jgi:GDPmannose 4,6-dehydratase
MPDECYHLAASSFVSYSFEDEMSILNNNVNATHYLLAALKEFAPHCRFYYAGTSEMFGAVEQTPQNESTPFNPRSIYGVSKVAGYHLVKNYRIKYELYACSGILYNHESPRRGYEYVTRKIISSAVRIKRGLQDSLSLGNLDAWRDWGYAPDYVQAMWLMLQSDTPDDFVVATGETHSVREFVDTAFNCLGLDYSRYVKIDPQFFRLGEQVELCGDPTKIITRFGWQRTRKFDEIISEMIEVEEKILSRDQ